MKNTYSTYLLGVALMMVVALSIGCSDGDNPVADTNRSPVISSLTASRDTVSITDTCTIVCSASDPDGDSLIYSWSADAGVISGTGSSVTWTSPNIADTSTIICEVSDGNGATATDSMNIQVKLPANNDPVISALTASKTAVNLSDTCTIVCSASDPDGDLLTYNWSADAGSISGTGSSVTWTSPNVADTGTVVCEVSDGNGATVTDSVSILVTNPMPTLGLIAYYPLDGDATDESGNLNNGYVNDAAPTTDRFGNDSTALEFNGNTHYIQIQNSSSLASPTTEITMTAWVYLNGWSKINSPTAPILTKSNTNLNSLQYRFDLTSAGLNIAFNNWNNTSTAAYSFNFDEWYMVTASFKNDSASFYVNGSLVGQNYFATSMIPNGLPLEIGRDTPGSVEVLNGKIDEVRIYARGLDANEVLALYHQLSPIDEGVFRQEAE